jgi:hypothetical protein
VPESRSLIILRVIELLMVRVYFVMVKISYNLTLTIIDIDCCIILSNFIVDNFKSKIIVKLVNIKAINMEGILNIS